MIKSNSSSHSLIIEEVQNESPQNVPLGHEDYFDLKATKTWQTNQSVNQSNKQIKNTLKTFTPP